MGLGFSLRPYLMVKYGILPGRNPWSLLMRPRQLAVHPQTIKRLLRLKRDAEIDGEYRVATRFHAVILNAEGRTSGEIAAAMVMVVGSSCRGDTDILTSTNSRSPRWKATRKALREPVLTRFDDSSTQ
jgi:hypothetical protein